jgi:hypothetical protein
MMTTRIIPALFMAMLFVVSTPFYSNAHAATLTISEEEKAGKKKNWRVTHT